MAVTGVGTPTTDWQEAVGSLSIARTVTAGSKGLSVQLTFYNPSAIVGAPALNWNTSELMTKVVEGAGTSDRVTACYMLADPTAGAHFITGTFSGTVYYRAVVSEWLNSSSAHDGVSAFGDSAAPSVTVPSVVAGEVILDAVACGSSSIPVVGSGQSTATRFNDVLVAASTLYGGASVDTSNTGSVVMDWSTGGAAWSMCAMALVEIPAVTSRPMFRGH